MVQDLDRLYQVNLFPESAPAANPVFSSSNKCQNDSSLKVIREDLLSQLEIYLNTKIKQIQKYSPKLSKIDFCTDNITRSLSGINRVALKPLREEDGSFLISDINRTIYLDIKIVTCIAQTVPEQYLYHALLIFLCHEISHVAQGLKLYQSVQRMRSVDQNIGLQRMGEMDLRSDFWAVHTLSLFYTLQGYGMYTRRGYESWFYKLWTEVCRSMLDIFPPSDREDKQQRTFGYLLMSGLITDTYISCYPLEFNAELWPVWSLSLDRLSIYSNGYPLVPGSPVDSALMRQTLDEISRGDYDSASLGVKAIWSSLPRR